MLSRRMWGHDIELPEGRLAHFAHGSQTQRGHEMGTEWAQDGHRMGTDPETKKGFRVEALVLIGSGGRI